MSITGYYDGTVIHVNEPLKIDQKVIAIPIEDEIELKNSAAGGLHKYADVSLIDEEKNVWKKAAVKKYTQD